MLASPVSPFDAESLASIAKGGITFLTPSTQQDDTDLVAPGYAFTLHETYEQEWLDQASAVNLTDVSPIPMMAVQATWETSFIGISRQQSDRATCVLVRSDHQTTLIAPADIFSGRDRDGISAYETRLVSKSDDQGVPLSDVSLEDATKIAKVTLPHSLAGAPSIPIERTRPLNVYQPEDCFVTHAGSSERAMPMIARQSISVGDGAWRLSEGSFSRQPWHGASVIAASDNRLIGLMLVVDGEATVVPVPSDL